MSIILPNTIKFVITDFDGVCTDNCVYIDSKGELSRKLNFKDIMAFSLLKKNGFKVGIISGEKNSAIDKIAETFKIDEVHQNIRIKIDILKDLVDKYYLTPEEVVYIGDDVNDIMCLETVKYKVTVPTANWKVKQIPNIQITKNNGGDGAFREVVDSIICPKF